MKNSDDYKKELNENNQAKQSECASKQKDKACGSCPGCSGERKRYATIYYIIPVLAIILAALILKFLGII
ncbi:MAG: hypothetical protein WCR98_02770 [Saccharofermentanales bacterium]|nr:hypothetical protein [Eubacteriales bacterium]MDD3610968.1 hypothetical protein [Eubacteriales bacterium]